jgi:hypothetical protein
VHGPVYANPSRETYHITALPHLHHRCLSKDLGLATAQLTNNSLGYAGTVWILLEAARAIAPIANHILPNPCSLLTMTDTPSIPLPLNPDEQPILQNLQLIRDELTLLKQDRTTYVKTKDVIVLYDRLVDQVQQLSDIRAGKPEQENRG